MTYIFNAREYLDLLNVVEGVVEDEEEDYSEPPAIFISYQWGHQDEVKLLKQHLEMAGYTVWMDIGQMGGGDKLFQKIDEGIRAAKLIISCVTEKYAKSPNCNREVKPFLNSLYLPGYLFLAPEYQVTYILHSR